MKEVAIAVFALTYLLISLQRIRGFAISRPVAALAGAGLMVGLGVLSWSGALAAIADGIEILALLLGMLVVVAALDVAGFFDALAQRLERAAVTPRRFFVHVCVASAVLSALFLNDAVVLMLTPPIIKVARAMGADPVPYLIGEAVCANIGSTATIVGNPQNAYIGLASGIPFANYAAVMAPITAACTAVGVWLMLWLFRKELSAVPTRPRDHQVPRAAATQSVRIASVAVVALIAFFVASSFLHASVAAVAMGGAVFFLAGASLRGPEEAGRVLAKVDWTILLMFAGLFVVLAGLESTSALTPLVDSVSSLGSGDDLSTLATVTLASSAASNAISNVPAVLLLAPAAQALASDQVWLVLASSSTMAGNATLLGAAANLIVAQRAEKEGVALPWGRFLRVGLPVSVVTVAMSTVLVWLAPV